MEITKKRTNKIKASYIFVGTVLLLNFSPVFLGSVGQSIVSLTSSLVVKILIFLVTSKYNI